MDEALIKKTSNNIYRRFPAVQGVKPRVQVHRSGRGGSSNGKPAYTLAFHRDVTTSNRKSLPYWVRVVIDARGKILKITTSR